MAGGNEEKERQQDFYIQQLQQDVSAMAGELFGRNGEGGFAGEVRKGLADINTSQKELQLSISRLDSDLREQRVTSEERMRQIDEKMSAAHVRLDAAEDRLAVLESGPGKRSRETVTWMARTAGYFLIGGALVLLTWGVQHWIGG